MKYGYNKTLGKVVEKPEQKSNEPIEPLPLSPEFQEQMKSFNAMQRAMREVFG